MYSMKFKKDKVDQVKEPEVKISKKGVANGPQTRKRGRTKSDDISNLTVLNEMPKSAKRKIVFSGGKDRNDESQRNNNATNVKTKEVSVGEARSRPVRKVNRNDRSSLESGQVKWTKEFLDRIKKSNERHKAKLQKGTKTKSVNNTKVNKDFDSLQVEKKDTVTKGDGIEMSVCNEDLDSNVELLNYEDDLSLEGEDPMVEMCDPVGKDNAPEQQDGPQPCCSTQDQQTSAKPRLPEAVMNFGTEEQLANNPVIQRMMKQFFTEQFKNIQMETTQGQPNVTATGKAMQGEKIVKSPSDTTIYAPALGKKLTPMNGGVKELIYFSRNQCGVLDVVSAVPDSQEKQNLQQPCFISNFVDAVRAEQHPQDNTHKQAEVMSLGNAQTRSEKALIEAEKFKATI